MRSRAVEVEMDVKAKRPTIHDVADRAGVSIKTVSRVLNDEPNVRPATRERVVSSVRELRYQPNLSARRLAANRSFVIAMLYDNPNPEYVVGIQKGSIEACRAQGYSLLIHPCDARSPKLVDEVLDLHRQATVDGFLLLQPVSDLEPLNRTLVERGIPAARVSQRPYPDLSWVSVADEPGARAMTEHLIGLGHRRIGFIMGHPDHGSSHDRLDGYRRAHTDAGIEPDPALIEYGRFDYESGYKCARSLLGRTHRPTAIFASNDHMALGVLSAAHEEGLDVPNELSVAGFDDTLIARFAWPPLTTIRQPIAEVARLATDTLIRCLENGVCIDHRLDAPLVRRASTGRPQAP